MPAKSVHRSGNQQATMVTLLKRTGRTLPGFSYGWLSDFRGNADSRHKSAHRKIQHTNKSHPNENWMAFKYVIYEVFLQYLH
jgi:hypothetical protein